MIVITKNSQYEIQGSFIRKLGCGNKLATATSSSSTINSEWSCFVRLAYIPTIGMPLIVCYDNSTVRTSIVERIAVQDSDGFDLI